MADFFWWEYDLEGSGLFSGSDTQAARGFLPGVGGDDRRGGGAAVNSYLPSGNTVTLNENKHSFEYQHSLRFDANRHG